MALPVWAWLGFLSLVTAMLALDLGVFHRTSHVVKPREAGIWTAVWVAISLLFAGVVYLWLGSEPAVNFLTAYVLEKSLAIDNIFVFILIFAYFKVPPQYQHRVLVWGVIGAVLMRAAMIFLGVALIERFEWILYIFGAFLLFTGVKMLFGSDDEEQDFNRNPVVKLARKVFRVSPEYDGERFFTIKDGVRYATPLFLALLVIEVSDVVFAVDSIPAVFAVTTDPFIVFTSNILAILGLRSMYFLLAAVIDRFVYLEIGLAFVLSYIGLKMILMNFVHIPPLLSLAVVLGILTASIVLSLLKTRTAAQ